jgi:hypothetical protein
MTEFDDLADEMAGLLGAPCTIEDPDFHLVAYSGQSGGDTVRQRSIMQRRAAADVRDWFHAHGIRDSLEPVRTPREPDLGIEARLCIPARHLNRVQGYFWLLDPEARIRQDLLPAAQSIAEVGALLLSQSTRRQTRHNLFYRELIDGDHASARRAARELASSAGFATDTPVTCILVRRPANVGRPAALPLSNAALWLDESPEIDAVILRGPVPTQHTSPDRLLAHLGSPRTRRSIDVASIVASGPTVENLQAVRHSRWGALTALRVAETYAGAGRVTHWEELGVLRLLAAAADEDLERAVFSDVLRAFLTDPRTRELRETARIYLANAGSVARTASALTLHRQTLYHRLAQIERATGLDLKDGDARLQLHLALSLGKFLASSPAL